MEGDYNRYGAEIATEFDKEKFTSKGNHAFLITT